MAGITAYHDVHPLYRRHRERWLLQRAAFLGGIDWYDQGTTYELSGIPAPVQPASQNPKGILWGTTSVEETNRLWRHPREKDWRYRIRLRASVYENVFRPFIFAVASTVARAAKDIVLPTGLDYVLSDVDRCGMDWPTFRLQRLAWGHTHGHCLIWLLRPDSSGPPISRYHEVAAGIRTYARILTPLDLLDWSWDAKRNEFRWALVRESRPAERPEPGSDAQVKQSYCTRLLREDGSWVRYEDGEAVEQGKSSVPGVPLVVQYALGRDPHSAEPIGIDVSGDAADKAVERFNKESWLTDQEANQCFNQAFIDNSELDSGELENLIGTSTYVPAKAFAWVAPSVAPMQHLSESIDRDASTMRQMLGLETKGEMSQAAKSGVALQLEQQTMSALLSGFATAAETADRKLLKLWATIEAADAEAVKVEYARDFSALDVAARRDTVVIALEKGGYTGVAKAELQKQLWMAACPDVEDDVKRAAFAEIDAGILSAEQRQVEMQQAAVDGVRNGFGQQQEQNDVPPRNGQTKPPPFGAPEEQVQAAKAGGVE